MKKSIFLKAFVLSAFVLFIAKNSDADTLLGVESDMSLWWTVYEESENGILQMGSEDSAAQAASGFNIKMGRLIFDLEDTERKIGGFTQIRFEERLAILDLYGYWKPIKYFNLYLGQMKVPSTYEVLSSDANLDFISRTQLSENLTDWSLSRSPYYSTFYGNRSDYRDVGGAIRGSIGPKSNPMLLRYFLMMSNGLGANLYIGGDESKEYIYSNDFGNYFYGARIDVSPIKWLTVGGHYSRNYHENMLFNDQKTVFDLDRYSWSGDIRFDTKYVRATGMYGAGQINDDYFQAGLSNLDYSGWEAKLMGRIWKDKLEAGVRYDTYVTEQEESDNPTTYENLTYGLNIIPWPDVRIQINYMTKNMKNDIEPDIDDNIFYINFQYRFRVNNIIGSKNE